MKEVFCIVSGLPSLVPYILFLFIVVLGLAFILTRTDITEPQEEDDEEDKRHGR